MYHTTTYLISLFTILITFHNVLYLVKASINIMDAGEVRVANDSDFEVLQTYLNEDDGWSLGYEDQSTMLWTRMPHQATDSFKMIRVRNRKFYKNILNKLHVISINVLPGIVLYLARSYYRRKQLLMTYLPLFYGTLFVT